jgi:hypothetical protein
MSEEQEKQSQEEFDYLTKTYEESTTWMENKAPDNIIETWVQMYKMMNGLTSIIKDQRGLITDQSEVMKEQGDLLVEQTKVMNSQSETMTAQDEAIKLLKAMQGKVDIQALFAETMNGVKKTIEDLKAKQKLERDTSSNNKPE